MNAVRWQQVQTVFLEALDQPPEAQAAFLAAACGDDAALRAEVESLLGAQTEPPAVLAASLDDLATLLPTEAEALSEGMMLGPYRIVERIGEGGMGTVYRAHREDVQTQVAIKLMRGGHAAPEQRRRFVYERRVLGRLQHPHIIALLDAGLTPGGVPYLVMPYVEGAPLDRHAHTQALDLEARLALFRTVCEAVAYAHQNVVVHRDLKPSNILVTTSGRVALLDFGIAKLLEGDDPDDLALTQTGMRLLSPGYASPEQVRGAPVTTASDVYALGVVLYELLTDARLYPDAATTYEAEQLVLTYDPVPPSLRMRQHDALHRHERQVRGDLDAICLKALEKEPEARYASAGQLLDDLNRYAAGLPITARQGTTMYRGRTFIRRHRVAVGAAVAVFLALLMGLAGTTWQAYEAAQAREVAQQERDQAQHEAETAMAIAGFLTNLFKRLDSNVTLGAPVTARQLLDQGAARIDTELAGQPKVQAELLLTIGKVYNDLGLYEEARPLLEASLALRDSLFDTPQVVTAQSQNALGVLAWFEGDYAAAGERFRQAVETYRGVYGPDHPTVGEVLRNWADVMRVLGEYRASEEGFVEALYLLRQRGEADSYVPNTLNDYALLLQEVERYAEALPLLDEAMALYADLDPQHPGVAQTQKNLAIVHHAMGSYAQAEPLYRESIQRRIVAYGADHPRVGQVVAPLAHLYLEQGDSAEAQRLFEQALAIFSRFPPEHPDRQDAQKGYDQATRRRVP